jgi:iron complex transport system substrate-binding protein
VITLCGGEYLESTHAPETLAYLGGNPADFAKSIMGRIYPELASKDSLWVHIFPHAHGPYVPLERLLALDVGAYVGGCGQDSPTFVLRRAGLPALFSSWNSTDWDDGLFSKARVNSRLIDHPERGEALIARYRQAFADFAEELHPETITQFPRVLILGSYTTPHTHLYVKSEENSYQIYFGIVNASSGWTGEAQDAERVLAMDPDIIFLMALGQSPEEFEADPRWRGLKAVREKRVYTMAGGGTLGGLISQPLIVRWMAEIAHPDRLKPRFRELFRARYMSEFNFHVKEEDIDAMLFIDRNKDQPGYARFSRNSQAAIGQSTLQ